MPEWFRYVVIAFGALFFIAHFAWMLHSLSYARDRDTRLEYFGKIVPGIAGLCIASAAVVASPLLSTLLVIAAAPIMIVGRAVYELVVFRGRADT